MDRRQQQTNIHTDNTRGSVSIHGNVSRSWFKSTNDYPKNDRNNKRNGHYKYLPAVILSASSFLTPGQALSETIGGVSATASPVANSSGSVPSPPRSLYYEPIRGRHFLSGSNNEFHSLCNRECECSETI